MFLEPTLTAHVVESLEAHVRVYVTIVNVALIENVLLKENNQIKVVSNQMLGNLRIRLTQVKRVNVKVSAHAKVLPYDGLFLAGNVIKDHDARVPYLIRR